MPCGERPLAVDNPAVLAALVLGGFALALLGWIGAYQVRMRAVGADLVAAEDALDAGEIERARALVAPLLARHPRLAIVQDVAGDILYAGGDPLSAASLWESAMKKLGAARVAPRLAGAYAALNRSGDVRRVAALVPEDRYAKLVLAWAELAALGGDRRRGADLAAACDRERSEDPPAAAMTDVLVAIAAAQRRDAGAVRDRLRRTEGRSVELPPHDRAFLGYLGGIALRDLGALDDARETWTIAMEASPDSIGSALARRERSHLPPAAS